VQKNAARSAETRLQQQIHRLRRTPLLPIVLVLIALFPLAGCGNPATNISPANPKAPTSSTATTKTLISSITAHTPATPTQPTTTTRPPTNATTPVAQEPGWQLTWSDEFNGPAGAPPDANKWSPRVGGEGWGNQQLDYDTDNKNAYQDGQGNLVLEADRSGSGYTCWYGPCQYTSAQITTTGHFSFTYGRIEGRIKIPSGQGFWSAFWMIGNNCDTAGWPRCGEVDIMEILAQQPGLLSGTVHGPGNYSGDYKAPGGTFANDCHLYALQWDPDHLYFSVDGVTYFTINRSEIGPDWVYDHPFSILLNLPIGGKWPGTPPANAPFPRKMLIDYVRIYSSSSS
jgi:beta-glucanase (GH16 family)